MHKNKNFGWQCQNFTIVLTWIFIFVFFFTLLTSENVLDRFRLPAFKDTLRVRMFIPVAGRSTWIFK